MGLYVVIANLHKGNKMKNIRQNVFETNSSMSHSISITVATTGVLETIASDENGSILLKGGDFSETELFINKALAKANLIAVWFTLLDNQELKQNFEEVVLKHTGASNIVYNIAVCGKLINSYITSQYIDYLTEEISTKENIKNFIFNPKSRLSAEMEYDG